MHKERIIAHTSFPLKQESMYVLYWLQSTQRYTDNYALKLAIDTANKAGKPLKVLFVLTPNYKDANMRHYHFMLEGLIGLRKTLEKHGIPFFVEFGDFETVLLTYLNDAATLVMDYATLAPLRDVRKNLVKKAQAFALPVYEVVNDLIVPPFVVSDKCEYAARTIRPKLLKAVDDFLELPTMPKLTHKVPSNAELLDVPIEKLLKKLNANDDALPTHHFKGGEAEALKRLEAFLESTLNDYDQSSDPSLDKISKLSPYLHFGMISPVRVYLAALEVKEAGVVKVESAESYLEQLLVRRELAHNFVLYCEGYDAFETMTYPWAYETMAAHLGDTRPYLYSKEDYINFKTHDPYFNACMREMVITGFMHNYMRMYWGKKIIEWSASYDEAYETILSLNNTYFLDGRDANSYASVAWLFGRHDRPWQSREIFGKLRYMNAKGLERKFDIASYKEKMEALKKR